MRRYYKLKYHIKKHKTADIQHLLLNLASSCATFATTYGEVLRVWMYSVRRRPRWNTHGVSGNLYATALICLRLQEGLRHTRWPCSALINGSGEMLDGEKKKEKKTHTQRVCVCAKTSTETLGFLNSLTILRDSPPQTCTHIYIHLINMDTHTVVG